MSNKTTIFTIGHSTRSIEEFIEILKKYSIEEVIDIRTIPKSRHNPQFNSDALSSKLHKADILYKHIPGLGGLRHTNSESINTAWENSSFRGFADYMQTKEFEESLKELIKLSKEKQLVIMCAEAVPWRCHRSLIGDALLIHHICVEDIFNINNVRPHKLTPWAKIKGKKIIYPA